MDENDKTISEVGEIYMSEMGKQISIHFDTVADLYHSKLRGVAGSNPQNTELTAQEVHENLTATAERFGFSYLGLYAKDGSADAIYGGALQIEDADRFMDALTKGEEKVTNGTDRDGENYLLFGDTLSLNIGTTQVYSHIIREDGTYVLKNSDAPGDSYFTLIRDYDAFDQEAAESAIRNISEAFENREDYSLIVKTNGEIHNTRFTPIHDSDWYLVSVLPYSLLLEPTSYLMNQRIYTAIGGCVVILVAMLIIYFFYYRMSKQQVTLLEAAKKEAENANKAKSTFLSNMSHDIRTPMNAIMGMTAVAASNIDHPEQLKDCLKKITLSSKHLLGLINDVLDMSKIESGKLSLNIDVLSLREVMENITNIAQPQIKAKNQKFDIFIENIQEEMVYCDGVRLNQILLNLVSNAIKFTPQGGMIQIVLAQEASPAGEEYIRTHFLVKDTGIGMSPEFQKEIFEAFARENTQEVQKVEGAGLGMAITKYIVDEMGGTISLQSEPGCGSEFHIILDLKRGEDWEKDMILPEWEMLVVDDDEQLCRSAAASLEEIGVKAEYAFDGMTAVRMTVKRHDEKRDYHIVLLDWKMPGLDGIETAREIRKRVGADVPIILISAYDWSEIEKEAREAGINGFISKPLFKSTLYYGLKRFTGETAAEEETETKEEQDFTGKRILLAEDNELNWEIACELLSAHGFSLEWAKNGKECIEKFLDSVPGTYDAVLMDIRMPEMDGYEATRIIRAAERPDAGLPIIAMTADVFTEDIRRCLECGMDGHIAKPLDVGKFLKMIGKYLNRKQNGGK